MIRGEEAFVQAIKDVRAQGAIRVELLVLLEKEYIKNPDPPAEIWHPVTEYEDVPVKDTKNFVIDPMSMKGAEDQFPGSDFEPISTPEQDALISQLYDYNPILKKDNNNWLTGKGLIDGFEKNAPWIQTYSGRRFNPLNPNPDAIVIQDIAHALSMQCRFSGHCRHFYSVAQHSVLVSYICGVEFALWGLLHDASEAYLVDMPRPLKRSGKLDAFVKFEHKVQKAVCKRFGLPEIEPPDVKRADTILLATEARDLMSPLHPDWRQPVEPLPFKIDPWTPQQAEENFLKRFNELMQQHIFIRNDIE